MIGRYSFKRGVCINDQSAINSRLVHENIIKQCFRVIRVNVVFFWSDLVFRHLNLFSSEKKQLDIPHFS